MNVLITGKNGRIGNAFMEYMKEHYPTEMEIDTVSLRGDDWRSQDWSVYDIVLHAVGITKADTTAMDADMEQKYYAVNRDRAVEAAKKAGADGVKHFIHLSTMMVYGNSAPIGQSFTIGENTIPDPQSVYGKSKLAGEDGVSDVLKDSSTILTIIREPVVYGEHIDGELQKLLQLSRILPVFPRIDSTKSYIYEGNLFECFHRVILDRIPGILCPQNEERPTTTDLFVIMRKVQGKGCVTLGHLQGCLKVLSHITRYVNAVFNDMKYVQPLSVIEGMDYQVYSLEESLQRCLR